MTAFDGEAAKHVSLLLSGCIDTLVMSANTGGEKAKAIIPIKDGELEIEAQKQGAFGNDILVSCQSVPVAAGEEPQWMFATHIAGHEASDKPRMSQVVSSPYDLQNNDFITIRVVADDPVDPVDPVDPDDRADLGVGPSLVEFAGIPLEGGSNGTVSLETRIPSYLRRIKNQTWQCMGWQWPMETHKQLVQQFVQRMRDENGIYVQVAMAAEHANHESTINVYKEHGGARNPATGDTFTIDEIALMVASMTAGADIITSNTNTPLPIQLEFDYELDNQEIIDGLQKGKLMFTRRRNGIIKIEQDINSLHTFTPKKNREFRKNNILRKLDEIGTTIRSTWENFFMGNEINDEFGRALYKAQVDTYFTEMMMLRALQNHSIDNLRVRQGNEPDAVVMDALVQPTDAMERLFMTVYVDTGVYFAGESGPVW